MIVLRGGRLSGHPGFGPPFAPGWTLCAHDPTGFTFEGSAGRRTFTMGDTMKHGGDRRLVVTSPLPASLRAPLYSHKLSLIGFWSLAFFYPFVGIHHYLYAPIAEWAQTIAIVSSMMLIIPVWTVGTRIPAAPVGQWE